MNTRFGFKPAAAILAIACSVLSSAVVAQEAPSDWKFSAMPYVWLPGVKADLKYGPPSGGSASANVSADESDILSNLQMAFMISGEARKGKWLIATDYMYLDLGKIDSKVKSVDFNPGSGPVNVSTTQIGGSSESSFKGSIWSLAGGYAVINEPSLSLDLLAGFRYMGLEAASEWDLNASITSTDGTQSFSRAGRTKKTTDITSLIIGAMGRFKLGQSDWFIPYYADFGGNGSTTTWQVATGVGYGFKWGDVRLDYRHLAYGQDDDKLLQKIELGGFALGANFRF
ncbi:MAG: hypothetical protein PHV02_15370 [Rhodocyclaceae bacterium]|nr:hypothetical protein [Rhodocyclaceae bacterium]